jgi:hypothetical protein
MMSNNRKDTSMKNNLIAIVVLILFPFFYTLGQDRIDVIYLKNGDILKGTIIENVQKKYVKIELTGGSTLTVKYSNILKFTKEKVSTDSQIKQQPRQQESSSQSDAQKMMYYENEKKSPTTAVLLSILLTSTGHLYADNWGRGLLFSAARVGGVVLALTAGYTSDVYSTPNPYGYSWNYYYNTETRITAWFYIGFGVALVSAVWEAIDASAQVDKFNERLYNKIMEKKQYNFNIVPSKNGLQLQLSYSF